MKIISWNVNGLRAVFKKGFKDWLLQEKPDILCLQETKAQEDQLDDEIKKVDGYESFFVSAEKKGYSGVAIYTKIKPKIVEAGFGISKFDNEGRAIVAEFPEFVLMNIYFPNGKASQERLEYKLAYYDRFVRYVGDLIKQGKKIIVCGDVNTAHQEIDLAHPKENLKVSGFLPEERDWLDKFLKVGLVDAFRYFTKEPGHYTWWALRTRARERNVGWRIDYFFVSENLLPNLRASYIMPEVERSDHCPIVLELSFPKS